MNCGTNTNNTAVNFFFLFFCFFVFSTSLLNKKSLHFDVSVVNATHYPEAKGGRATGVVVFNQESNGPTNDRCREDANKSSPSAFSVFQVALLCWIN